MGCSFALQGWLPGARRSYGGPARDTRTHSLWGGAALVSGPETEAMGLTFCKEAALALAAHFPSTNQMANISL